MANNVTTYKKIKAIRDNLGQVCAEVQKAAVNLPSNHYKTKGGARLALQAAEVAKVFNRVEGNLAKAHKAANALGSVRSFPKAASLAYKLGAISAVEIRISSDEIAVAAASMGTAGAKLEDLSSRIQRCINEISGLKVTEQLLSSLTVIDILYPIAGLTKAVLITRVKTEGTANLRAAKDGVDKLSNYFMGMKTVLENSSNKFIACEDKVKSRTFSDLINTTSQITVESNTPREDIQKNIVALEEKQQTYMVMYGAESAVIADEIARLKKMCGTGYINLQSNMGNYSMKQGNYGAFTVPYGYNAGCCATAYAIGLSIVRGKPYAPTNFWHGGTTHYDEGGIGAYEGFNAARIYEALKNGKPTMLHYNYTASWGANQHWIIITGIREGADPENLSVRDFIAIDPATGTERTVAEIADSNYSFNIQGMKVFS